MKSSTKDMAIRVVYSSTSSIPRPGQIETHGFVLSRDKAVLCLIIFGLVKSGKPYLMLYMKGVSAVLPPSLDYHAKAGSHTATQFHLCRLQFVLVTLCKMTTTINLQSYLNLL